MKLQPLETTQIPQFEIELTSAYEKILLESIDQAFLKLGEKTKQMLYTILKANYKINKQDIPHKTDVFTRALQDMLGVSALMIEIYIIENIHQRSPSFAYDVDNKNFDLVRYVESFKGFIESNPQP
jgi:hypothetical protein